MASASRQGRTEKNRGTKRGYTATNPSRSPSLPNQLRRIIIRRRAKCAARRVCRIPRCSAPSIFARLFARVTEKTPLPPRSRRPKLYECSNEAKDKNRANRGNDHRRRQLRRAAANSDCADGLANH